MRAILPALFAALAVTAYAADLAPLYPQLERARHIAEGAQVPKSVLYVFFDPNCYYCNLTWRALQPYEKVGLQVRWVPVAYQKDNSAGMAAAMLEARDPAAALRENELRYKVKNYDGGIKPLAKVSPEIAKSLEDNLRLMRNLGAQGTPAVVWKDAQGNIGFRNAVPKLSDLPKITGLPAQQNDDRALKEFR
jgi:thiol:disulfide interchange protein DsbG